MQQFGASVSHGSALTQIRWGEK